MSRFEDGGSAFPVPHPRQTNGMTLRDYFAAKAMQAMTSDSLRAESIFREAERQGHSYSDEVALQAYEIADTMLRFRQAKGPDGA